MELHRDQVTVHPYTPNARVPVTTGKGKGLWVTGLNARARDSPHCTSTHRHRHSELHWMATGSMVVASRPAPCQSASQWWTQWGTPVEAVEEVAQLLGFLTVTMGLWFPSLRMK